MKELALHIARQLVDQPDKVDVTASEEGGVTRLMLKVAEEDKGKIIGKQGKVIKAIRAIVGVAAAKADKTVVLDVE
ncbi:MAG TPA: RNA-binding protein [Elusimicrobia bacterium]|nr:RNA-binding protein [Elusimicrobiota bacterium]